MDNINMLKLDTNKPKATIKLNGGSSFIVIKRIDYGFTSDSVYDNHRNYLNMILPKINIVWRKKSKEEKTESISLGANISAYTSMPICDEFQEMITPLENAEIYSNTHEYFIEGEIELEYDHDKLPEGDFFINVQYESTPGIILL